MKRFLVALPLLIASTPALATGGFDCRTTDGSDILVSGTIGRVIGTPLIAAHLRVGNQPTLGTTDPDPQIFIVRSWIDARDLWVDLGGPTGDRIETQLRVRIGARSTGTGTLVHSGRRRPVRCEVE